MHSDHAVDGVQDDGQGSPRATIRCVRGRHGERDGPVVPRGGGSAAPPGGRSRRDAGERRRPRGWSCSRGRTRCGPGSAPKALVWAGDGHAVGHRRRAGPDRPPARAARVRGSARRALRARHGRGAPGADRRRARDRARSVGRDRGDLRRASGGPALRRAQLRLARRGSRRADRRQRRWPWASLTCSGARTERSRTKRSASTSRPLPSAGSTWRRSVPTTSRAPASPRRRASAAVRSGDWRLELFGSQLSPGRLLPATSLFSVLGDLPSQTVGATVRWRAAPRLDLLASGAGQDVASGLGGNGWLRATLRLDDQGDGSLGLEVRRVDVPGAQWTGVRAIAAIPLGEGLSLLVRDRDRRARPPRRTGRRVAVGPVGAVVAIARRLGGGRRAGGVVDAASPLRGRRPRAPLVRPRRPVPEPLARSASAPGPR